MHRSVRLRALLALLLGAGLVGVLAPPAAARGGSQAVEGGRLDYYWDDFAMGDPAGLPDLLPLVAGTRADVELRLEAPRSVTDADLTLWVPDSLGAGELFPYSGFGGGDPSQVDPAYWGAVTVRPAGYFPFEDFPFRPEGHCTPVPGRSLGPGLGTEPAHTVTRVGRGQLIRIPGVTCAAGELLRVRLYGVALPDRPRSVLVPWALHGDSGIDAAGIAHLRVEKPSNLRIVVEAPDTHQLEQVGSSTSGTAYDVVVRVVRPNGKPAKNYTGWLDVTGDMVERTTFPCHVLPVLVHVGPEDDGVVVVPAVPVAGSTPAQPQLGLPGAPAVINAWALDRGVEPGSDGPVEALPPPGWPPDQPILPSLVCPTSYH